MANKRYDEFTPGTPDGARLILHADPSDGSLESATISELPFSPSGLLFAKSHFVNANNSGSNPQTISQITIPANTIVNTGDWLEWDIFFTFITGAGTKTVDIKVSGSTITGLNSTAAFDPWFKIKAINNGSNQFLYAVQARSGNTNVLSAAWGLVTFNPANSNTLDVVVAAGAVNNITMRYQSAAIYTA